MTTYGCVCSGISAVTAMPQTRDELQCLLGCSKATVRRLLEYLHAEPRCIHVVGWRASGGELTPVWSYGTSPDAPRPRALTKAERNRMHWKAIKRDPFRHQQRKASDRAAKSIRRLRGKRQGWAAALLNH